MTNLIYNYFTYDYAGRVTIDSQAGTSGNVPNQAVFSAYDAAGNRTWMGEGYSSTSTIRNFYYDAAGRLTSIVATPFESLGTAPFTVSFGYNAASQLTGIDRAVTGISAAQPSTVYGYNNAGRLNEVTQWADPGQSNLVVDYSLAFDALSRIIQLDTTVPNPAITGQYIDDTAPFSYDRASQLTGGTHNVASFGSTEAYAYDPSGNRTSATAGSTTSSYTTGVQNRLTGDGTFSYLYDKEGNLTTRTKTADGSYTDYQYDNRNRLITVTDHGAATNHPITQSVAYLYDGLDRRVRESVTPYSAGVAGTPINSYFVYDGRQVLLEYQGTGGATPTLQHRYLQALDQVMADETSSGVLWQLGDHQGSIRDVVSASTGQTVSHTVFDAYGNLISSSGTPGLIGYAGMAKDASTGDYWTQTRIYSPTMARWTQPDPIVGDPPNAYWYARNNPVNAVDRDGLMASFLGNVAAGFSGGFLPSVVSNVVSGSYGMGGSFGGNFTLDQNPQPSGGGGSAPSSGANNFMPFPSLEPPAPSGYLNRADFGSMMNIPENAPPPQVVSIRQVGSWLDDYDRAVAEGQGPNIVSRAAMTLVRPFIPSSDPDYVVTYNNGSTYVQMGGGPTSGDLGNQALAILSITGVPQGRPGSSLSTRGEPYSSESIDYGNGRGTIRDYDAQGRAMTDYDFGHNHGAGDPHAHDWDWSGPKSVRQPGRSIVPGAE